MRCIFNAKNMFAACVHKGNTKRSLLQQQQFQQSSDGRESSEIIPAHLHCTVTCRYLIQSFSQDRKPSSYSRLDLSIDWFIFLPSPLLQATFRKKDNAETAKDRPACLRENRHHTQGQEFSAFVQALLPSARRYFSCFSSSCHDLKQKPQSCSSQLYFFYISSGSEEIKDLFVQPFTNTTLTLLKIMHSTWLNS